MTYSDLKEIVEEYLSDDWMGIWVVCKLFENAGVPEDDRKVLVLESIERLLLERVMIAGDLKANNNFVPWSGSESEIVARIENEWNELGEEPNINDIVWFSSIGH